MDIDCLPFKETGYFSKLICDYIEAETNIKKLYNNYPDDAGFKKQLKDKEASFPLENRIVLNEALLNQYNGFSASDLTLEHINSLKDTSTFTIVTGHQLNLFTGPLYFLYKIIATINLTEQLKKEFPDYNFVPVYWMATEDHDFDEINYFNFQGKKLQWNKNAAGAVGHLETEGLDEVLQIFAKHLGGSKNALELKQLFEKAYLQHGTLTEATRFLTNELFGKYGLVIVDGDDRNLKRLLIPFAKKDILEQTAYTAVNQTISLISDLDKGYPIQVNPRAINYFYLQDGVRERIIQHGDNYMVNDTAISFSEDELLKELEEHPERFSPNVIARPLYQEVILPNLCYIGGGGEIAYWLELKAAFEAMEVPFPILLLRNSALVISKKQLKKLDKIQLSVKDLFLKQNSLINKKIREISNIEIDFTPQKSLLEKQFKNMYKLAEQTDKSFLGAVKAQEVKQKKGLDHLEKRLLKAQKRKLKDQVIRMTEIQSELFPGQSLQERNLNFSELYLEYGDALVPMLKKALVPLQMKFTIIST